MSEQEADMQAALNSYIDKLHTRNLELIHNIDAVESSLLWKLILPLRAIENGLRSLVRRSRLRKVKV